MMPYKKSNPQPKVKPEQHRIYFDAIGTKWIVESYFAPLSVATQKGLHSRIEEFDFSYSRFRKDSLVSRMAQKAGTYDLPDDAYTLLQFYRELYDVSGGAVTPLIGQALSDAGYDANYSLRPSQMHVPPTWDEIISFDETQIVLTQPALLDFGAAGKGYLVDIIAEELQRAGVKSSVINAGGDICVMNVPKPVSIGLEDPHDFTKAVGIAQIEGGSLCGSAGTRRSWSTFNHILSPFSLSSPTHLDAVWVTADSTMIADGLATALYFVAPETLTKSYNFEYALLHANGTIQTSQSFPAKFFTSEG